MEFLDLMHEMFALQKKFPEMQHFTHGIGGEKTLVVSIPISDENAELLAQGKRMFQ